MPTFTQKKIATQGKGKKTQKDIELANYPRNRPSKNSVKKTQTLI